MAYSHKSYSIACSGLMKVNGSESTIVTLMHFYSAKDVVYTLYIYGFLFAAYAFDGLYFHLISLFMGGGGK